MVFVNMISRNVARIFPFPSLFFFSVTLRALLGAQIFDALRANVA